MSDGGDLRLALAAVALARAAPAEPQLAAYHRQFTAVLADAEALVAPLSVPQLEWQPAPPRWSVALCLNHLNVTAEKYLPRIAEMTARGRAEGRVGSGPFRHPFAGNWFIRMLEPPPRRRLRVPGIFAPVPGRPAGSLLPEFLRLHGAILDLVTEADGLDLAALRTSSPAARLFILSLGQCFGALSAHDRRHLWQARQVVGHPAFPTESVAG